MRILINAVQRSGSKFLSINLRSYLSSKYNTPVPILDNWFELGRNKIGDLNHNHLNISNYQITVSPMTTSYDDEVEHRIKLILNYNEPLIIKLHPDNIDCARVSNLLYDHYTCYNLTRKDLVEHTFSWQVTNQTCNYGPGEEQKKEIAKLLGNPSFVTENVFKGTMSMVIERNDRIKNLPAKKNLYFEDLIAINSSEEFCEYLELPVVDFDFKANMGLEYGEHKKRMIANYEELQKFGRYLVNKYNVGQ